MERFVNILCLNFLWSWSSQSVKFISCLTTFFWNLKISNFFMIFWNNIYSKTHPHILSGYIVSSYIVTMHKNSLHNTNTPGLHIFGNLLNPSLLFVNFLRIFEFNPHRFHFSSFSCSTDNNSPSTNITQRR